jgi:methylthioribulose-1-phosphate dehydratase
MSWIHAPGPPATGQPASAALPMGTRPLKELLCELLRQFYSLGWCTGTGGGLSVKTQQGYLMAPSGVAKERVRPDDIFELDPRFEVVGTPRPGLSLSECAPLFRAIYEKRGAGAVIHTHSIAVVLATRRDPSATTLSWERLEMIKGIAGARYPERHAVPLIENAPQEAQLTEALHRALDPLPGNAHAVFVRDHGAYVWGRDVWEAKRHAEVYDWLCQFSQAEGRRGS